MARRIAALIHKEYIQIMRDPIALLLLLVLPVAILCIFGYAINLDIRNIPFAVLDRDRTETSRTIVERFVASGYFSLAYRLSDEEEIDGLLDRGSVKAVMTIPQDFQKDLLTGKRRPVQVLIDGTDSNTASIVMGYTTAILQDASMDVLFSLFNAQPGMSTGQLPVVSLRPNIWYNPELKSMYFLIPGIIGIIIMVIGAIRMSISLVKEKESGTIESIMVSPLRPAELMIGKIVPYVCIVFIDLLIIVVFSVSVFDVPFRGSIVLFLFLSLVFLAAALGTGLFVSAVSKTTQVAWLLGFLLTILPSILLSGFIFPIESMPRPIQAVTLLLPVRYFLTILRGIILKGVGLDVLYPQALVLVLFAGVTVAVSSLFFKKRF